MSRHDPDNLIESQLATRPAALHIHCMQRYQDAFGQTFPKTFLSPENYATTTLTSENRKKTIILCDCLKHVKIEMTKVRQSGE